MLLPFLFTLPWLAALGLVLFGIRWPRAVEGRRPPEDPPAVSVIVPARNEAVNIESCVGSLVQSHYPDFEIIVVDDRSEDGTAELARDVGERNARSVCVVDGADLPEGWLGKPWACAQGAERATGDLLLFTDADTTHGPGLLASAVAAMEEDGADLLTLVGRQLMESFWERLMQPHIFLMMLFRYPDFEGIARRGHWRDAIANGQFMLFRRKAYEALGGHEAVRGEVVEDQALAQHVKRRGLLVSIRSAEVEFATRMYRSLGEIVEGWSKNIVLGARASLHPVLRPLLAPGTLLSGVGLWLAPPVCLALSLVGVGGPGLLAWSAVAVLCSVLLFGRFTAQMSAPPVYGLLYPLGATVSMLIVLRGWLRGSRVVWKGREYRVSPNADG